MSSSHTGSAQAGQVPRRGQVLTQWLARAFWKYQGPKVPQGCPATHSPESKAAESVGRVCRERLRPVFTSLLSSRGEPIQLGSSQLLFPEWPSRVGLVGALMARSYICGGTGRGTRLSSQPPASQALSWQPQPESVLFIFIFYSEWDLPSIPQCLVPQMPQQLRFSKNTAETLVLYPGPP